MRNVTCSLILIVIACTSIIAAPANRPRVTVDRDGNPIPTIQIRDAGWSTTVKDQSLYLVIPISGGIGKEVTATGVDRAITYAVDSGLIQRQLGWMDRLYLMSKASRSAMKLLPLVQVGPSPQSAKNTCYFFDRLEPEGARFVSYHFTDQPDLTDQFHEATKAIRYLTPT